MDIRRSNRTLFFMMIIIGVIGAIIISNVLFTMVTHKHFRSGVNIKEFKDADISNTQVIKANRGTIYDRNNEVIAQDEDTYTIVAYLDESRKGIGDVDAYVKDIRKTARLLANELGAEEESIYNTLQEAKDSGKYQTELGIIGKNINNAKKEKIESLQLPGIEFTKSVRRNYPNGVFASHLVGYAQYDEKGNNVYLTLDRNVQLTLQSSLEKTVTQENAKVGWGIVMEVETGRILGYASYPSFDLNNRNNLKDYTDVPANYLYEPGSVMKGITYAAAIDSGVYPYDSYYNSTVFYYGVDASGKIYRSPTPVSGLAPIRDALGKDFGKITFDEGFKVSSNIAICELLTNYMNPEVYREYVKKFGFLREVAIPFVPNSAGSMAWEYASDKLSTGFGQGISINALQMAQAYTAILNDGKMVRPYVVERIVDANSNKIIKQYDTKQVATPIKKETSEYMRKLMAKVVEQGGTGYSYALEDVQVIAKTGTGEIATENGYDGSLYTNSVMLAAPADDPKVMVYYCFQSSNISNYSREPMKELMRTTLVAANITSQENTGDEKTYSDWKQYSMPSLTNHSLSYAQKKLAEMAVNTVVIGNGTSIVKQYPQENQTIVSNQNIFLLSDGTAITMPDMTNWTKKDITAFWELTGISIQMEGSGRVVSQNVAKGTAIDTNSQISVKME